MSNVHSYARGKKTQKQQPIISITFVTRRTIETCFEDDWNEIPRHVWCALLCLRLPLVFDALITRESLRKFEKL